MKIAFVTVICVILIVILFQYISFRRELESISQQVTEILNSDTNAMLTVSSRNKAISKTAASFNRNLRELRKKELMLQSKSDEISAAIINVSHDLRTPLTAICGYLDILRLEEKPKEVARCLEIIENRTEALKRLTEELFQYSLTVSGEDELAFEELSVNAVLEESIAAYYAAFREKGIEPKISITDKRIIRNLDKTALLRIFANILSNALKYSDGDLEIVLTDAGNIIFANKAQKLDEIQVGKIFDRFYTVENARTSTGLGLSIARGLVQKMNGEISALYSNGRLEITVSFNEACI